jgi:hypothetical protein
MILAFAKNFNLSLRQKNTEFFMGWVEDMRECQSWILLPKLTHGEQLDNTAEKKYLYINRIIVECNSATWINRLTKKTGGRLQVMSNVIIINLFSASAILNSIDYFKSVQHAGLSPVTHHTPLSHRDWVTTHAPLSRICKTMLPSANCVHQALCRQ